MELFKHQQELVDKKPEKWLLAWQTGTGKSLAAMELSRNNSDVTLIVCPKSIKDQWAEEAEKNNFLCKIYTKEEFKKYLLEIHNYPSIIIDECHYFSGMQGFRKKSGMLKALLIYIRRANPQKIYLLTATPYLSTPWNIYALAEILGYKWNYQDFKDRFFNMVNMGRRFPVPLVKKDIEPQIAQLVNQLGDTVKLSDCVDVPEQQYFTEYFDLTSEQKNAIKNITEVNHIVRWTKTHQICGGTLKSDGYVEDEFYKSEKINRLIDLVNQNKKVIVVCRYNNELDYLKKILKSHKAFVINGMTSDKHTIIKEANQMDECVLLINAACSEGYELPTFPMMIFYSYDFSLKNFIQIIGRIQRINAIKKNVYISLVVKNTIDEDVYKCINKKKDFDIAIYESNIL